VINACRFKFPITPYQELAAWMLMRWSAYDLEEAAFLVLAVTLRVKPILQAETVAINIA
jgi:hypothetical protein